MERQITLENVFDYTDLISEGAIWYSLKDGVATIENASPKGLEFLQMSSLDELISYVDGNLWSVFKLANVAETRKEDFKNFVNGKIGSITIKMYFVLPTGKMLNFSFSTYESTVFPVSEGRKLMVGLFQPISVKEALYDEAKLLIDSMQNGLVVIKKENEDFYPVVYGNRGFSTLVGRDFSTEDIVEKVNIFDLVYESDHGKLREALEATEALDTSSQSYRIKIDEETNSWQMAFHKLTKVGDEDYIFISYTNIQDIMGQHKLLQEEKEQYSSILDMIPMGIGVFHYENDVNHTIAVNNRLVEFSNFVGKNLDGQGRNWSKEQLMLILSADLYAFSLEEDKKLVRKMLDDAREKGLGMCTFRLRGTNDKNAVWIRSFTSYRANEKNEPIYYVTFSDATEEMRSSLELMKSHEELKELSYKDPLTGVFNRNAYNELIDEIKKNPISDVGLVFADVNGLKSANDTYGHLYGDKMIIKFASILQTEFLKENIYRISGDEFVIVFPNVDRQAFKSKMHNILMTIDEEEDIASVGYIWLEKVVKLKQAVASAEDLMYIEKQKYYAGNTEKVSKHRTSFTKHLVEEFEQGMYQMYLQPKSMIEDTNIVGAEALVRKFDSKGKMIFPDEFIPQLESMRLIPKLDYFMIEEVCKTLKTWRDEGRRPIKISVNVSRVTLAEEDFINQIMEFANKYDVDRNLLEFEITESTATMDYQRLIEAVTAITDAGFSVSLDDMGTDYSSLKMLLVEGVSIVKLDRSFILKMDTKKGHTLLKYTIDMCHELGLNCIAEGVEEEPQRESLQHMGCDMYQGYMLSKPIPIEDFEKMAFGE